MYSSPAATKIGLSINLSKTFWKLTHHGWKTRKMWTRKNFFSVPCFGKSSQLFTKQLCRLIANLTTVKLIPTYKTFQVGNCFNLKSRTPTPLVSIVVYRFSCLREADLVYIGKSASLLVTRVKVHWVLNSITRKSTVKEHILDCNSWVKSDDILKPFSILRKRTSDYDNKIHEAVLIKNTNPNSTGSYMEIALRSCKKYFDWFGSIWSFTRHFGLTVLWKLPTTAA